MRPRGEVRAALSGAAEAFVLEQVRDTHEPDKLKGVTWRQLAELACVGYAVARATVKNMVNAGELVPLEPVRVPGSHRPMTAYVPRHLMPTENTGLNDVLHAWGRG